MIAIAHLSAGAAAGTGALRITKSLFRASLLAFIAGIVLHIGLDAIPHSDYGFLTGHSISLGWLVLGETILTLILVTFLSGPPIKIRTLSVMASGMLGSALPDISFFNKIGFDNPLIKRLGLWGDTLHGYFHNSIPGDLSFSIFTALFFLLLVWLFTRPDPA